MTGPCLAAALVLAVLLGPTPAQAAPFFLELTGTVESPVPIQDLGLRTAEGSNGATGPCNASYYAGDRSNNRFRFEEGGDVNGCVGVAYTFAVPAGVRRVTVTFLADRALQDSPGNLNLGPAALEQEVRLRIESNVVAVRPYFSPQQGEQASQPFAIGFDVPADTPEVEVEWWFANRGEAPTAQDPSAGQLQAWSATVSQPAVLLQGIQLATPALRERGGQLQGDSYLTGHTAEIAVPPEHHAAAADGRFSMHLRMPASALIDRLLAPDGNDLHDDDYETAIVGESRLVTVPSSTLARLGPGPYTLRFQASEPVQVEPSMAILTVLALLMPPVALVFAVRQLRRRSLDTYLEAADALEGEFATR